MPTDLPPRRIAPAKITPLKITPLKIARLTFARPKFARPRMQPPKASREGNIAFAVAIIVMLVISAVLLWLHPAVAASVAVLLPMPAR